MNKRQAIRRVMMMLEELAGWKSDGRGRTEWMMPGVVVGQGKTK